MPNLWAELFTYYELIQNMKQLQDSTFIEMQKMIKVRITPQMENDLFQVI